MFDESVVFQEELIFEELLKQEKVEASNSIKEENLYKRTKLKELLQIAEDKFKTEKPKKKGFFDMFGSSKKPKRLTDQEIMQIHTERVEIIVNQGSDKKFGRMDTISGFGGYKSRNSLYDP
jgi:hypothetical protein